MAISRRKMLIGTGGLIAASAAAVTSKSGHAAGQENPAKQDEPAQSMGGVKERTGSKVVNGGRSFNSRYDGEHLDQVAFPMGGIGAGMICLEGSGALTKFSVHNRPELTSEPKIFAAVAIRGAKTIARILEVPCQDGNFVHSSRGKATNRQHHGVCHAL